MTSARERRIEEICQAALDHDVTDRATFVIAACGSDEALLRDVESLLALQHAAEHFMDATALEASTAGQRRETGVDGVPRQIGPYHVLSVLGLGGMGEVYRAHDPKLNRDVALKVLPEVFSRDGDRLRRFKREAQALASLNHPNIAAIYGFEDSSGRLALVLELVDGLTLAQRIAHGAIAIDEVLLMTTQIASAVDHAHKHGIVHRDLKPANITLRPDGVVKVLDFGLAKALGSSHGSDATTKARDDVTQTQPGIILGTAAYMSPEQARAQAVDQRTDVWAFGCVLYEMLTGQQAFPSRGSVADTLVHVLEREPNWALLPAGTPATIRTVLERCLEKDPSHRLPDIGNVGSRLDEVRAKSAAGSSRGRRQSRSRGQRLDSIAILPLVNESSDPNVEYLSEGISETIVNSLSRLSNLKVIGPSAHFHARRARAAPQVIGSELAVRAVLTGKVFQIRDHLVIRIELTDAADGSRLWGEQYDRRADDILEVQKEISQEIVTRLRVHLTTAQKKQLARSRTDNVTAYQHYLRGRYCWNKRSVEGFTKALDEFQQAIVADSNYALAYVGLADCYAVLPFYDRGSPMQYYSKAKAAATRALDIDSTLSEAHAALGHVLLYYDWDWSGAARELTRAISLAPSNAEAHHIYAYYLAAIGRTSAAIERCRRSLECDPVSLSINASLGVMLYLGRQYENAVSQLLRTIDLDGSYAPAYAFLAWAYTERGMHQQAIAECERATRLVEAPWILASLGYAHASAGHLDAAERLLDELDERARSAYVSPYDLAVLCTVLGREDEALRYLDAAFHERSGVLIWGVKSDPRLDRLRGNATFAMHLERIGLGDGVWPRGVRSL